MARENDNRSTLTLRDVALAALELDADARGSVSWEDIATRANAIAADRAARATHPQASKGAGLGREPRPV